MTTSSSRVNTASDFTSFGPRALATHPSLNYVALSGPLGISVSKLVSNKSPCAGGSISLEKVLTIRHANSAASDPQIPCFLKFSPTSDLKLASAIGSGITLWDVNSSVSVPLLARLTLPPGNSSSACGNKTIPNVGGNQANNIIGNSHHKRLPSDVLSAVGNNSVLGDSSLQMIPSSQHSLASYSISATNTPIRSDHGVNNSPARFNSERIERSYNPTGVSCLSWMATGTEVLVTRGSEIFMYDVRCMKSANKPIMQFFSDESGNASANPFSCVESNENCLVGAIDNVGIVRIFDSRRFSRQSPSQSCLTSFQAHDGFGAGIAPYKSGKGIGNATSNETCHWITWGYDTFSTEGCVKIWESQGVIRNERNSIDPNLYWYEGSLVDETCDFIAKSDHSGDHDVFKSKEFAIPSICCARTCPPPLASMVITVENVSSNDNSNRYCLNANMWDFDEKQTDLGSFFIDIETDLSCIVGHKITNIGTVIASEVVTCNSFETGAPLTESNLALCCLSSSGYLLTYRLIGKSTKENENIVSLQHRYSSMSPPRVERSARKSSISSFDSFARDRGDNCNENFFWHLNSPRGHEENNKSVDLSLYDPMNPLTQFEIDVQSDSKLFTPVSPPPNSRKSSLMKVNGVLSGNEAERRSSIATSRGDPELAPCPRLCGASFGYGNGKLVTFSNGGIQKMWSWLKAEIDIDSKSSAKIDRTSTSPRTLSDLLILMNASKKAQWGDDDDDESDSSNDFSESNSSSDEDFEGESPDENEEMLQMINTKQASISLSMTSRNTKVLGNLVLNRSFDKSLKDLAAVLSTETLTPHVEYKSLSRFFFGGQSHELAKLWRLGSWFSLGHAEVIQDEIREGRSDDLSNTHRSLFSRGPEISDDMSNRLNINSTKSNLELRLSSRSLPDASSLFIEQAPELPRPSSVGSNLSRSGFMYDEDDNISVEEKIREGSLDYPVRTVPRPSDLTESDMKQVLIMDSLCTYNANVCHGMGQQSKGEVWSVLSQSVRHAFSQDTDEFNGWRRVGGGALGQELVTDLLRHYESEGDIQMCATIVCCLRPRRISSSTSSYFLTNSILPDNDEKYNMYLYNYANLLYYWGHVTIRAEVLQHANFDSKFSRTSFNHTASFANTIVPHSQITISPLCPQCKIPSSNDKNSCVKCKDFAFRCSICNNAVRGLFSFCMSCGHGGHSQHLLPWFTEHDECPTGCGCFCSLETFSRKDEKSFDLMSL